LQPRVLLVTSEAVPLVKTGGLADVITALADALIEQHIDATILMPGYPAALDAAVGLRKVADLPGLPGGDGQLLQGYMPDGKVPVLLLSTERFGVRTANPYVDHSGGEFDDNALCFASLAHAAICICAGRTSLPVPHLVHANDWHAGLIPALLRAEGIKGVGTALTIHNLAFQGNYSADMAPALGIPSDMVTADGMEFWGKVSFLKAGIRYADRISTVSDTYAKEILTPRFGNGMDGVLNERKAALCAIPNGVDVDVWNPAADSLIVRGFNARDLSGKAACKRDLQKLFNLPVEPFAPVMAIGSRITHQKMADVVLDAMPQILDKYPRLQLVVLGCGERKYEQGFAKLAADYPNRVGVHIGYTERRAHALHAGADMLLHGSRFEPYGLTPIYSMLYGTIPVGSRVGGLCDTIVDAGASGVPAEGATGVLFDGERAEDLIGAVDRTMELLAQPSQWERMQRNAMTTDFAWSGPARQYIQMYADIAPVGAKHAFLEALVAAPAREVEPVTRVYKTA
jgi:starch synthase